MPGTCEAPPSAFTYPCDAPNQHDIAQCDRWRRCSKATCGGRGSCSKEGACVCPTGWRGLDCSISTDSPAWSDEFDDFASLKDWHVYVGCRGGGNGEAECYTDTVDTVLVRDGALVLRAVRDDYGGTRDGCDDPDPDRTCLAGGKFRSGRVDAVKDRSMRYGRLEVRARVAGDKFAWPAAWLSPVEQSYGVWPQSGEIDLLEVRGGRETSSTTFGTVHYGASWQTHEWREGAFKLPGDGSLASNFHVYALEWTRDAIEWFVDGHKFHHQRIDRCFPGEEEPRRPFDMPFVPILNLAVGGNFFPDFTPKTFDADTVANSWPGRATNFTVDYVRVYNAVYDDNDATDEAVELSTAGTRAANHAPIVRTENLQVWMPGQLLAVSMPGQALSVWMPGQIGAVLGGVAALLMIAAVAALLMIAVAAFKYSLRRTAPPRRLSEALGHVWGAWAPSAAEQLEDDDTDEPLHAYVSFEPVGDRRPSD